MNGIILNNKTITGLSTIQSDIITSDQYYTTDGMNVENAINALSFDVTTTSSNLQSQLDNIVSYDTSNTITINSIQNQLNNITSTTTSGGGYFIICCERLGHAYLNTFGFGAGLYNNNEIVLPACTLIMSRCTSSLNMTSGTAYYNIYKNGVATAVSTGIYSPNNSNTVTHNLTFASGDTLKIVTINSGSYSSNTTVQLRINLIFQSVGIKGADGVSPTITVGNTTTLSPGFNASVVNSGTSTNAILNFSIPQGFQGERGLQGLTPLFSIGSVTNLASGASPSVSFDATSSDTMKIINFSLVRGEQGIQGNPGNDAITPSFVIGTVSNLASGNVPFVNFDNASSTTNKIMNFGLVQGEKGEKGDSIKGDKGDPGPAATAGDIGNALGTSAVFIVLQGQVTLLQTQMTTVQGQILTIDGTLATHTGEITTLTGKVTTLEGEMDIVNDKLLYVTRTPDALQVTSKFQITTNSVSMTPNMAIATFDPVANTILTGTTGSTNSMVGNTVNIGSLTTANNTIRGVNIIIGNESGANNTVTIRGTTVTVSGSSITYGFSTTIHTMRGSTLNIGNAPGGSFPATVNTNIRGTTITMGNFETTTINTGFSGTTTNNIKGNIINVGENVFSTAVNVQGTNISIGDAQQTTNVEIEGGNIRIGTAGFLNNVYIGNTFSNVRIESMDNAAIGVGNFFDQINP